MTDDESQWSLWAEGWLLGAAGMSLFERVKKIFRRKDGKCTKLIIAKVIDDFLVAGITRGMYELFEFLSDEVDKTAIEGSFL